MDSRNTKRKLRKKRSKLISGTPTRPRVVIFKSNRYLAVQAIDDVKGHTLVAASTAEFPSTTDTTDIARKNQIWAEKLGVVFAEKLRKKGITTIIFDRNGYPYHGKIQVFCETVRQTGIQF